MTGEEMERAIEFLLKSQASLEGKLDQLTTQVTETGRQLSTYAETQSEFIRSATQSITGLAEAQMRTDAKLDKLIGLFEQHIVAGH
jgi:predicted  nucleic acid-binding Zn-ribbon protein